MHPNDEKIEELKRQIEELTAERDRLRKQVNQYYRLQQRDCNVGGEEAGIAFERDLLRSAVSILSNGKYGCLNEELLTLIRDNSSGRTLQSVVDDFMKKAS